MKTSKSAAGGLYLLLAILIAANISMGQELKPLSDVNISLDTTQRGPTIPVSIQIDIRVPFIEASLMYELSDTSGTIIKQEILWEGKSSADRFEKQFNRSLNVPVNSKVKIYVGLRYRPTKYDLTDTLGFSHGYAELFIHRTSRWITYGNVGFYYLENIETTREIEEKYGVRIRELDAKEFMKLPLEIRKEIERKEEERSHRNDPGINPPPPHPIFSAPVIKPKVNTIETIPTQSDTTAMKPQPPFRIQDIDTTITKYIRVEKEK